MGKLKLSTKEDIRTAIRRRGYEIAAQLTDAELFSSFEFKNYITKMIDFILRKHKLYNLILIHDTSPQSTTAFTDGKDITVNTGNILVTTPNLLERRFKVALGLAFHEAAHKLFMNFTLHRSRLQTLSKGKLAGNFMTNDDPVLEQSLNELQAIMKNGYRNAITSLYAELANCINDGHDEAAMMKCFPGFIKSCIDTMDDVQFQLSPSLNEYIEKRADELSIYSNLILSYCIWGDYKIDASTPEVESYLSEMSKFEIILDEALQEDDYAKRWDFLNSVVLYLWPHIRNLFPERDRNQSPQRTRSNSATGGSGGSGNSDSNDSDGASGSSDDSDSNDSDGASGGSDDSDSDDSDGASGGSDDSDSDDPDGASGGSDDSDSDDPDGASGGSDDSDSDDSDGASGGSDDSDSDMTPDEIEQFISNVFESLQNATNSASAPLNGTGSGISSASLQPSNAGNDADADTIKQSIAEEMARTEIQNELDQEQMNAIRNCNMPYIHSDFPVKVTRHFPSGKAKYDEISKEIAPYVRTLISNMQALLKDLNEESVQRHRSFGPIIEAKNSYRPDHKFFAKKKLPNDLPNMSICVLLDQSGSMSGSKIEFSKKALILIQQFADTLGIPLMIAGHDAYDCVNLFVYTDFISTSPEKDRFSLGSIHTDSNGNRDGVPIRLCCEALAARPEDVKLMVIISDGAPYSTGYSGQNAMDDISKTVREFRRKGLLIYGAAIDEDREVIQKIYGKGFLSITNLSSLPKTLVRLIRQNIT